MASSIAFCTSRCTSGSASGSSVTAIRSAGVLMNESSGMSDKMARAACGAFAPASRIGRPCVVVRATESAGKLASQSTSSSPWPIAASTPRSSGVNSGSRFFSIDLEHRTNNPRVELLLSDVGGFALRGLPRRDREDLLENLGTDLVDGRSSEDPPGVDVHVCLLRGSDRVDGAAWEGGSEPDPDAVPGQVRRSSQ